MILIGLFVQVYNEFSFDALLIGSPLFLVGAAVIWIARQYPTVTLLVQTLPGFVGDEPASAGEGVGAGAGAGAKPASAPGDDGGGEGDAAGTGFSQTSFEWSSSTWQFQAAPPAGALVGFGAEARVQRQLPASSSQLQPELALSARRRSPHSKVGAQVETPAPTMR